MIEIIVSVCIILMIGVISFIYIKIDTSEDKIDKIITDVVQATDVYYSLNKETLKEKISSNYGYLVLEVDQLKEIGILDKNIVLPDNSDGKDYSKIVIFDGTTANGNQTNGNQFLSNTNDVGITDYIYPFEKNDPFIVGGSDITIEHFELKDYNCKAALDDEKLLYLNENYELSLTSEFYCKYYDKNGDKIENINNVTPGSYKVQYSLDEDGKTSKQTKLIINKAPDIELFIKDNSDSEGSIYDNEKTYYFNNDSNATIYFKDINNDNHENIETNFDDEESTSKTFITGSDESKEISGKATYKLCGRINKSNCMEEVFDYKINLDNVKPTYEIDYSKAELILKDDHSGIKKYCLKAEKEQCDEDANWINANNNSTKEITKNLEDSSEYYLGLEDNAGNKIGKNISTIAPIVINLASENISTFSINVKTISPIKEMKIMYDFNHYLKNQKESDKNYLEFQQNYANKNFEIDTSKLIGKNTIEKEIDLKESINKCVGYVCREYITSGNLLNNFTVNYYVSIKTENGAELEKKYKISLNVNKHSFGGSGKYGDGSTLTIDGITSNGNVFYHYQTENNGYNSGVFSANNFENKLIKDRKFEGFDEKSMTLCGCELNYKCKKKKPSGCTSYKTYDYNRDFYSINGSNINLNSSTKGNNKKCSCSFTSGFTFPNDSFKLDNIEENAFIRYLIPEKANKWDDPVIKNPYYFSIEKSIIILNDETKSIIIRSEHSADSRYILNYYLLSFKNEVTIKEEK